MGIVQIDVLNKTILLSVFLIGLFSGVLVSMLMSALTEPKVDNRKE